MIDWKNGRTAQDIIDRMLGLQLIKDVGAVRISEIEDEILKGQFLIEILEGEDDRVTYAIDWGFVLFFATEYQIESLLRLFDVIPKPKKKHADPHRADC